MSLPKVMDDLSKTLRQIKTISASLRKRRYEQTESAFASEDAIKINSSECDGMDESLFGSDCDERPAKSLKYTTY